MLPVPEILAAIDAGRPLPERTVGITVDDATRSTFEEAWPRFEEAGFPFISSPSTRWISSRHLSWDELRQLVAAGVTIGNHSAAHGHMWRGIATRTGPTCCARIKEKLGVDPRSSPILTANGTAGRRPRIHCGLRPALRRRRGAFVNLPPATSYGDIDRFRLIVDTLPLGARDVTPTSSDQIENPPTVFHARRCFRTAPPSPAMRVALMPRSTTRTAAASRCSSTGLPAGRARLNCTAPGDGRWRGLQFVDVRRRSFDAGRLARPPERWDFGPSVDIWPARSGMEIPDRKAAATLDESRASRVRFPAPAAGA